MKSFIPRAFLVLSLMVLGGMAHAENTVPAPALPQTQDQPPVSLIKKAKLQDLDAWMQLPEERRILIVDHWLSLPETTRPAFPLYRTLMLKKHFHDPNHAVIHSVVTK